MHASKAEGSRSFAGSFRVGTLRACVLARGRFSWQLFSGQAALLERLAGRFLRWKALEGLNFGIDEPRNGS